MTRTALIWMALSVALAAALATPRPVAAQSPQVERLLRKAEQLRSTDPVATAALLAELDVLVDLATEDEKQRIQLLHAYQSVIAGNYDAMIKTAMLVYSTAQSPSIRLRAALLIANSAAANRDADVGMRYLAHALELSSSEEDQGLRHETDLVAAITYNQYGQYGLGRMYAERLLERAPSPRNRCVAQHLRVEALYNLGQVLDRSDVVQQAIRDCVAQREPIATNYLRADLARHWRSQGKIEDAVRLLRASLPEVEATRYGRLIGEFKALLAELLLESGDVAGAERLAQVVLGLDATRSYMPSRAAGHKVLYQIAVRRNDLRRALDEYRKYAEADKASLDDIKARELAFQLSRHEMQQKNQAIKLLSKQNEVLRLEQEVGKQAARNTQLFMALLMMVLVWAGVWIFRARRMQRSLRKLAEADGLTGLANRRHFRARTEALLFECKQRRQPVSILLFDLDHFKQINDQCGHSAGDWVLREVARVGKLHCRQSDLYGRIGGEEFAITLVDCDLDMALHIAEECRRAIASIDGIPGGCTLPVSASIGCVGTSGSSYDYEKLMAHADAAMYRAKVAGRNRVCLYEPSVTRPAGGSAHVPRIDDATMQV